MNLKQSLKALTIGISAVLVSACQPEASPQAAAPAAPQVNVAQVIHEQITEWDEFTGRLQAPEQVTLIPRVSGYIDKVHFQEGAAVTQGDVLFEIDGKVFSAEVSRLEAELTSAQSAQHLAKNDFSRANKLFKQKAVSEELIDTRRANMHQAAAAVASVEAALTQSKLNLAYTQVTAPISGRVSYAEATAGNYVTAGQTVLTNIVSTSHMYAYFDVDEQTYLKYARLTAQDKRQDPRSGENPVLMALANEAKFHHQGTIDFVDNKIDQRTGTIRVRAKFANDQGQLIPGLFARLRIAGSSAYQGILVDDKAIGTDLNNKFVLVVKDDNSLEYRGVQLGEKLHGMRIITSGLKSGETIVVNSLQRVRPNMTIEPMPTPMANAQQLEAIKQAKAIFNQAPLTASTAEQAAASQG
ncbi:efflux RND transporter periplasmic adaptor subunit [Shewanella gelidii]|uniref:MexE family multidrug efflux RND transporter periplasmic adaptor subunit n=1 Tax=Shewanella gelidii TaxID=1642821 RepID=A0A917JWX3_9GAMM|nr:efflux RND transporter periplasmic adaptor subunit [Shewanella gelidii]MCL1098956.1 efflux RND transporter periplasmic adaptor subunit [Shewanella gelidii]GGI90235.1 MexE family multidrug efflux RND transporter periplasmic adaptor subunit [Shewanella gelidii]